MKFFFATILILVCMASAFAQSKRPMLSKTPAPTYTNTADSILSLYADSLKALANATPRQLTADHNLLSNPYYYRMYVSPLVYRSSLRQAMNIGSATPSITLTPVDTRLQINRAINNFFLSMYTQHPYLVHNTETVLDNEGRVREDIDTKMDHKIQVSDVVKPKEVETVIEPVVAVSRKPNFWKFNQNSKLQIMQNYASDNWYQGSYNYNSMLVKLTFDLNYNNRQKVIFENKLEANLGFQTDKEDKEHKFKTTEDLLRLTNKLGIQASKHWYYTLRLQSWTQSNPKYNANSNVVYSDFMSPFESVLSIGMDYKKTTGKFKGSINIAPLAYDFKYVDRKALTSRYGIKGDHHSYETFGSNLTIRWEWQIFKELKWETRVYYFTNYEKVQAEWENNFRFTINKHLSTNVLVYPRFDDSYKSSKSNAIFQFKEYLSLGLDLNF